MKKLRIIAVILGIIIALFVVIGIVFSTIYEDKVKAYIIEQINNSINTKIDVKDVEFSIFKKFPYASLEFQGVRAEEMTNNERKGELFSAQSIYLQFNIIDILNENYIIKKVQVDDGIVNIKIDKFGNDNYHFWKKSGNTEKQLSIELEKLSLKRVNFYILNDYKGLDMDIEAVRLSLSGNFSQDKFTLNTQANLLINQINDKGESVLKNKTLVINTSLAINQVTQLYQIKKGEISLEQLKFSLSGSIRNKKVGIELDINSKGNKLEIEKLFSLFPTQQREALSAYKTEGKITYTSTIKGELSIKKSPDFNVKFSISNGVITERASDKSLSNLNVTGNFSNGKNDNSNTSKLSLNQLEADFGAGHISGNYIITNFANPYIDFNAKANINISTAKDFFKLDTLEIANGNLEISLKYDGSLKGLSNIKASELRKLNASGMARLSNTNLKLVNDAKTIKNINGAFQFSNNDVQIDILKFDINQSSFEVDGKLKNLLAYLFVEGEYLVVKTNFHANKLILAELLIKKDAKNSDEYTLNLPKNIILNFNATVDTFQFRKFNATNFKGNIQLEDKVLTATDVSFNSMNGKVQGNIALDDSKKDEILITSKVNTTNIAIYELFDQFENFGQKTISAKNIKGRTSTSVEFASVWDKHLKVKKDKIYVLADVNIKDGELINYKPVLALSKYIEIDELKHIKFSSLITHIEIKNQTVYIPKTDIKSNALDLTISGTHTFDNKIDYRFKLLMSDILWKKAKKKKENSEFGYIEDDGLGRTTLFLHMTGTVDNYNISYDTKGLKESWKEDLKKEKTTLKTILNKEFGWFKKDSTLKKDDNPADDGFIIEWEEAEEGKEKKDSKNQDKKSTSEKKKGLGKFIEKITKPDDEEFEEDGNF